MVMSETEFWAIITGVIIGFVAREVIKYMRDNR